MMAALPTERSSAKPSAGSIVVVTFDTEPAAYGVAVDEQQRTALGGDLA